jgi:hypothetical protein
MASDNKNNNELDKFLFSDTIINQFSSYVDNIEKFKNLESTNRFFNSILCVILLIMILHIFVHSISEYIPFICIAIGTVIVCCKIQIKGELTNLVEDSFKRYIILHLLDQKEVINFPSPLDCTGFEFVKSVLDEIHIFDPSIYIIEHIGYTADKHIESVTIRDIDSEKLKKIINLNKLEHFDYMS